MSNKYIYLSVVIIFVFESFPIKVFAEFFTNNSGPYYGTATISTPTDITPVDLAFHLDVSGSAIQHDSSYILLEKTMLFPAVPPEIGGKAVGPRVSGNLSPTGFTLVSDIFDSQAGDRAVKRQIRLDQAAVTEDGQSITGTYTETVTGLLPQDLIISGQFVLVKPVSPEVAAIADGNSDGCLDVAEIRAGGSDPVVMEFRDAGAAMAIYKGDGSAGQICAPADELIKTVLQEYFSAQH